jgi:hypothetical protein
MGRNFLLATGLVLTLVLASGAIAASLNLNPVKDNTLYEDIKGVLSNGAGQHFFAGVSDGLTPTIRRAVLAFDIAGSLPVDASITSVTLTLNMSRTATGEQVINLHRLESDWGEGASDAAANEGAGALAQMGDATCLHAVLPSAL